MAFQKISLFIIIILLFSFVQAQQQISPADKVEYLKDMDRYVRLFSSRNALISMDALDYTISYLGEYASQALLKGLTSPCAQVRCFCAIALSRIPDKRAVPLLLKLLQDKSSINLQVLSDDGLKVHSCYGGAQKNAVRINALRALQSLTSQSFGYFTGDEQNNDKLIKKWQQWWKNNSTAFQLAPRKRFHNRPSNQAAYPIPAYARYLQNICICLDPGHGGEAKRMGYKRGPSGTREAETNLRVTRYLRDFLVQCGAKVLLTRDSDRMISLKARCQIANNYNADLFLSIHHNWSPRYTAQATTFWYHHNVDHKPASMDLARYLFQSVIEQVPLRELDKAMGLKADTLIYRSGFGVLRNLAPEVTGILCELAFYSNLETELKMRNSDFLKREAYALFLGLARYIYAGIPHWRLLRSNLVKKQFTFRLYDGLEQRKEWGWDRTKLFSRHLRVELDGKEIKFSYNTEKAVLQVQCPNNLAPGEHSLQIFIINLHKNHNWPKRYKFNVR